MECIEVAFAKKIPAEVRNSIWHSKIVHAEQALAAQKERERKAREEIEADNSVQHSKIIHAQLQKDKLLNALHQQLIEQVIYNDEEWARMMSCVRREYEINQN